MNQVVTFEDSVKAKLKGIVAELIPEEKWDELVRAAVSDFEHNDLPKLVKEELTAKYKELIRLEFAQSEWQTKYANGVPLVSEAVSKLIQESAPLVLASLIGGSIQNIVQQMQYGVQNVRGY